jgi:hypothetical protein
LEVPEVINWEGNFRRLDNIRLLRALVRVSMRIWVRVLMRVLVRVLLRVLVRVLVWFLMKVLVRVMLQVLVRVLLLQVPGRDLIRILLNDDCLL